MSSTGFAPLSVWLRKPRNLKGPEGQFLLLCEINNNTIHLSFEIYFALQELPYVQVLDFEYGFIFKIAFIRLCFHQHYNIIIETLISTHVCLVPVAFSVHGHKCEFRWTREVHAKLKTDYARERRNLYKKRQIHQKY